MVVLCEGGPRAVVADDRKLDHPPSSMHSFRYGDSCIEKHQVSFTAILGVLPSSR
jgi:hypothetical protein